MKHLKKNINLIKESGLFDIDFYHYSYHVPKKLCVEHYLLIGYKKGYNPSLLFLNDEYRNMYLDVKEANVPPLLHYILFGKSERRRFFTCWDSEKNKSAPIKFGLLNSFFDLQWYVDYYHLSCNDFSVNYSPLDYYIKVGYKQKHIPNKCFMLEKFYKEYSTDFEPVTFIEDNRLDFSNFIDFSQCLNFSSEFHNIIKKHEQFNWIQNNQQDLTKSDSIVLIFAPNPAFSNIDVFNRMLRISDFVSSLNEINKIPRVFVNLYDEASFLRFETCGNQNVIDYSCIKNYLKNKKNIFVFSENQEINVFSLYLKFNRDDVIFDVPFRNLYCINFQKNLLNYSLVNFFNSINTISINDGSIYECPYLDFFDPIYYKDTYLSDNTIFTYENCLEHYLNIGWKLHYSPFSNFDIDQFYSENQKCITEPLLYWYESNCSHKMYFKNKHIPLLKFTDKQRASLFSLYLFQQNYFLHSNLSNSFNSDKYLIIIVSPEDAISGGIMSFYGIYKLCNELKYIHGREVFAVTLNKYSTHSGFTMFSNDMHVLRYSAIAQRIKDIANDIMVFVPELYTNELNEYLSSHLDDPILTCKRKSLNIMNQKIEIMPSPEDIEDIKKYFDSVTQTAAHFKYCTQKERDYYNIPTHLLIPPIIKNFKHVPFENKENIFAYSYDEFSYKKDILKIIENRFPSLKFIEIKNMSFDEYLTLVSKAKWCMTFGEGLDGYFSEPYQSGTISFAIWNELYFTSKYKNLRTIIHETEPREIANSICSIMEELDNNKDLYEKTVESVKSVHAIEYSLGRSSKDQLIDFFNKKFDFL